MSDKEFYHLIQTLAYFFRAITRNEIKLKKDIIEELSRRGYLDDY